MGNTKKHESKSKKHLKALVPAKPSEPILPDVPKDIFGGKRDEIIAQVAKARSEKKNWIECVDLADGLGFSGTDKELRQAVAGANVGAEPALGAPKPPKAPKEPKAKKEPKPKKEREPSGLDLAVKVLAEAKAPMNAKDISDGAIKLGWATKGATPNMTIYSAIIREIAVKGKEARFKRAKEAGMFEVA